MLPPTPRTRAPFRACALFAPALGSDAVLQPRRDDVRVVFPAPSAEGAFAVRVEVPQYYRRWMVAREIALEFVAQSTLFFVFPLPFCSCEACCACEY